MATAAVGLSPWAPDQSRQSFLQKLATCGLHLHRPDGNVLHLKSWYGPSGAQAAGLHLQHDFVFLTLVGILTTVVGALTYWAVEKGFYWIMYMLLAGGVVLATLAWRPPDPAAKPSFLPTMPVMATVLLAAWHVTCLEPCADPTAFTMEPVVHAVACFIVHLLMSMLGLPRSTEITVMIITGGMHVIVPVYNIGTWNETLLVVFGNLMGITCGSAINSDQQLLLAMLDIAAMNRRADSRLNHVIKGQCGGANGLLSGLLMLLEMEPGPGPSAETRELLSQVHAMLDDAAEWCHKRELFVQLESRTYQMAMSCFDLCAELENILGSWGTVDSIRDVSVDRSLLQLLVNEALSNALKYREPGTLLKVRAEMVPATADTASKLHVTIENVNRVGVPPLTAEECDCVFRSTTKKTVNANSVRSDGLGLDSVRIAVQAVGGEAWLTASQHSTTFHLKLPATAGDSKMITCKESTTEGCGVSIDFCNKPADEVISTDITDSTNLTTSRRSSLATSRRSSMCYAKSSGDCGSGHCGMEKRRPSITDRRSCGSTTPCRPGNIRTTRSMQNTPRSSCRSMGESSPRPSCRSNNATPRPSYRSSHNTPRAGRRSCPDTPRTHTPNHATARNNEASRFFRTVSNGEAGSAGDEDALAAARALLRQMDGFGRANEGRADEGLLTDPATVARNTQDTTYVVVSPPRPRVARVGEHGRLGEHVSHEGTASALVLEPSEHAAAPHAPSMKEVANVAAPEVAKNIIKKAAAKEESMGPNSIPQDGAAAVAAAQKHASAAGFPPPVCVGIDDSNMLRKMQTMLFRLFLRADMDRSGSIGECIEELEAYGDVVMGRKTISLDDANLPPADIAVLDENIDLDDEERSARGSDLVQQLRDGGFKGVTCILTGAHRDKVAELMALPGVDFAFEKNSDLKFIGAVLLRAHTERKLKERELLGKA